MSKEDFNQMVFNVSVILFVVLLDRGVYFIGIWYWGQG